MQIAAAPDPELKRKELEDMFYARNSPFPRDCDEHGVRPDRWDPNTGQGMRLPAFAQTAAVSRISAEMREDRKLKKCEDLRPTIFFRS